MSVTPRPWASTGTAIVSGVNPRHCVGVTAAGASGDDDAELIVRAVNAFAPLLAVAKAAHLNETYSSDSRNSEDLNMLLAGLDIAHPGWLEWTP